MYIIKIEITEDQKRRAEGLYNFGELKGSITKGKSNIYGAIGEVLVWDFNTKKGNRVKYSGTADYDLVINGKTVDVKSKRTTVQPKSCFNCSIANWNTRQKCDYYYFVRVMEDLSCGYLLGYIRKSDFFDQATFNRKGDPDGNFFFTADCYNIPISKLNSIHIK
jgi:hypothetical protein